MREMGFGRMVGMATAMAMSVINMASTPLGRRDLGPNPEEPWRPRVRRKHRNGATKRWYRRPWKGSAKAKRATHRGGNPAAWR